jgi:hypothetical protein
MARAAVGGAVAAVVVAEAAVVAEATGAAGAVAKVIPAMVLAPWAAAAPAIPAPRLASQAAGNPAYGESGFVFTRIRYDGGGGRGYRRGGGQWAHDYPRADRHLSQLLAELTFIDAETRGTNVLELDDPELFRYPVAYISEPGFWDMSDAQAALLRAYVLKGGFLILDDFEGRQLENALYQLSRALPELRPIRIEVDHPIFQSFFAMKEIYFPHPLVNVDPVYLGLFEENDPTKRMVAIINHNNDIAEYWEWSAEGWFPVDITNDAYKLGINYITYAMTH